MEKLIRDLIAEIIKKSGRTPIVYQAENGEFRRFLRLKLREEVEEFLKDESMEEVADILEVIEAICEEYQFEKNMVEQIKQEKKSQRGSFIKKTILIEIKKIIKMKLHNFLFIFIIFFSENYMETATTVRMVEGRVVNIYVSCPQRLTYQGLPFLANDHDLLLTSVERLGRADLYRTNHLLVQICCLYRSGSQFYVTRKNICWDEQWQSPILEDGLNLPFIDFLSRGIKNHRLEDIVLHPLDASEEPLLVIPHSEHLFTKYLENHHHLIKMILPKKNCEILGFGLIFYSSLDSCDDCQDHLLYFFSPTSPFLQKLEEENIAPFDTPWFICFFSSEPCKKSSYVALSDFHCDLFFYEKNKRKFFLKDLEGDEYFFPCSIEAFDLKGWNSSIFLISHIRNYPKI